MKFYPLLIVFFALLSSMPLSGMQTSAPESFVQPSGGNEIVYLIANPRSGLVEFLRMMSNFGKYKIMHIPANWAYCHAHNYTKQTEGWYREDAPATYAQAQADILKEAEKAPVFVGENTHTAKDFLEFNTEFVKDKRVRFIFLISNPHSSIISYYKKKQGIFDTMPDSQISDSMGLKGLYDFMQDLKKRGCMPPLVIKSEDLYFKAVPTVRKVCDYLQIPFKEECLHWEDLGEKFRNFSDYGWYTIELTQCAKDWHSDAIRSTGFSKPSTYALDKQGNPTFDEILNQRHRDVCIKAYEENIVYYNRLIAAS